jgi:hypothetical protein
MLQREGRETKKHTLIKRARDRLGHLLGRGIRRGRGVLVGVVSHGNLDGELTRAVGRADLLIVEGLESLLLGGLIGEGNETIATRAGVAHADDMGSSGVEGLEHIVELSIVGGEGQVGNEEGGLGEGTVLLGLTLLGLTRSTTSTSTSTASATTAATTGLATVDGTSILALGTLGATGTATTATSAGSARLDLTSRGITSGLSARLGNLDVDLATSDVLVVHKGHSLVGLGLRREAHESVAKRAAASGDHVGGDTIRQRRNSDTKRKSAKLREPFENDPFVSLRLYHEKSE